MLEHIIDILAPHYCVGCKTSGTILCEACSIEVEVEELLCYRCQSPTVDSWLCLGCSKKVDVSDTWIAGYYKHRLKAAVACYKFQGARRGSRDLARLVAASIPFFDQPIVVCNIPTTPGHVRQRGYDHAALLAKHVARQRGLEYRTLLGRQTMSHQLGAGRLQRRRQAEQAFTVRTSAAVPATVLLIDDVVTTGATIEAAAHCLKHAGVKTIYVAVVAFEPLDK